MTSTTFDITCYNKLHRKFQFLFEPDLIKEICRNGRVRTFKKEEELIGIGQMITHIPLVLNGSVKVMSEDEEGHELLLYYLELGDTCAVTLKCCSSASKSTIRAVAEEDTEVLFIPVARMEDWMVKFKTWRNFVLDSYDIRLKEMLKAIDSLAFDDLHGRLTNYLSDKVLVTKTPKLNITHHEIANDLNSSRVVISRLLKKMEMDNLVKLSRNHVEVLKFL